MCGHLQYVANFSSFFFFFVVVCTPSMTRSKTPWFWHWQKSSSPIFGFLRSAQVRFCRRNTHKRRSSSLFNHVRATVKRNSARLMYADGSGRSFNTCHALRITNRPQLTPSGCCGDGVRTTLAVWSSSSKRHTSRWSPNELLFVCNESSTERCAAPCQ